MHLTFWNIQVLHVDNKCNDSLDFKQLWGGGQVLLLFDAASDCTMRKIVGCQIGAPFCFYLSFSLAFRFVWTLFGNNGLIARPKEQKSDRNQGEVKL